MKYIFQDSEYMWHLEAYYQYLESIRSKLPDQLAAFICDPDRNGLTSKKSLHDAWLESITISENVGTKARQPIEIAISLLGPYHDRRILARYFDVFQYKVDLPRVARNASTQHGDLLVHEFLLENSEAYSHEFVFSDGGIILIGAKGVQFNEEFL